METFDQLLSRRVVAESRGWHQSTIAVLSVPTTCGSTLPWRVYEDEVFNFLLADGESLGIANVLMFKSLLVDGAVEFADGRRLALEIKFRMNWEKACQAEWQFRNFLKRKEGRKGPWSGVSSSLRRSRPTGYESRLPGFSRTAGITGTRGTATSKVCRST